LANVNFKLPNEKLQPFETTQTQLPVRAIERFVSHFATALHREAPMSNGPPMTDGWMVLMLDGWMGAEALLENADRSLG
jgi:hypothetical protein